MKKETLFYYAAVILCVILLRVLIGVNFFVTLGIFIVVSLLLYFWNSENHKRKSKIFVIFLIAFTSLVFVNVFLSAYLPLTYAKLKMLPRYLDSESTDNNKIETEARDIWEIAKAKQSKDFLLYYDSLLRVNKPREAMETLQKFNDKWDKEKLEKK